MILSIAPRLNWRFLKVVRLYVPGVNSADVTGQAIRSVHPLWSLPAVSAILALYAVSPAAAAAIPCNAQKGPPRAAASGEPAFTSMSAQTEIAAFAAFSPFSTVRSKIDVTWGLSPCEHVEIYVAAVAA
jgi:hypothetical protein